MANCPECGGQARWRSPFYVCEICGLSLRRHELERAQNKLEDEVWDARFGGEQIDDREKRKREYEQWYEEGIHKKPSRTRKR